MRLIKNLFLGALELLGINALFRRANRGRIKTLMYHSISPDGSKLFPNANFATDFSRQLAHLQRHYSVIGVGQDGSWRGYDPNRVNVLLTFDDGFRDNYEIAVPLLKKYRFPGCFFLISCCLPEGASPAFAAKYAGKGGDLSRYTTVTGAQARDMLASGMTIGSHGDRHKDYSTISFDAGLADAMLSKRKLAEAVGCEVALLAFPWGRHHHGQPEFLYGCYRRIFTTEHGFNHPEDRLLRRNEAAGLSHMRAAASGSLDFFARLARMRR